MNAARRPMLSRTLRALGVVIVCALLTLAGNTAIAARAPQTQVITLYPGWNLVSLQVGATPLPVASFKNGLDRPDTLIEIWGYQPTGDPLTPGFWRTYQPLVANFPGDLATLDPGRGYWVRVGQVCQAAVTGVPWDGGISLVPGWNLVGFPGLVRASSESQDLASVFGANFARVPQVWTFDNSAAQRFLGYDLTAIPTVKDLTAIVPGRGYWVYALQALDVTPGPVISLPGDADASPLQPTEPFSAQDSRYHGTNAAAYIGKLVRFAGAEDAAFDLNANGILDDPYTQDSLRFDVGVDRKFISVANTGAGLLNWVVDTSGAPWLAADVASGTVASEVDKIVLSANRAGLLPGSQTGTVVVYAGNVTKTIAVRLDVPTAAGDWKGYATTTRVNGKTIGLGAVDMTLNLFMLSDSPAETGFRAVLDRNLSLLFPEDVFMNGIFYAGNNFSLTTNFEMPPADRNVPPYDSFGANPSTGDPKQDARLDQDLNGNKKLDVANPFPFAVHRQITLLGTRTTPDHLEGTYVEAISGMLPQNQSVFIEGTFFLDRRSLAPTKKSVFNGTGKPTNTVIGGGSPANASRSSTITVGSSVAIQGVTVTLNVDFPVPRDLTITLTSVLTGKTVTLARNPASLASSVTYTLNDFNGLSGAGDWKLTVAWDPTDGERGYFNGWTLNVQGLATYALTGRVVDNTSTPGAQTPLAGVHVVLSGSNLIQQADTDASGNFSLPGLTQNNYTLALAKPGYSQRNVSLYLKNSSVNVGAASDLLTGQPIGNAAQNVELQPVTLPDAIVQAAPLVGADPMFVTFSLLVPKTQLTSVGANPTTLWDFGDGTPSVRDTDLAEDDVTLTGAKHLYTRAGTFTATATITGAGGTLSRQSPLVLAHRTRPDSATGAAAMQIVGVSFVGSFAAPLTDVGNPVQLAAGHIVASYDISNDGNPPLVNVAAAVVPQESKRDAAGFDLYRFWMRGTPPPALGTLPNDFESSGRDSDFFLQPGTPFAASPAHTYDGDVGPTGDGTFSLYFLPKVNGLEIPDRFRVIMTLGGAVFSEKTSQVGDFVLQAGRVESEP